MRVEELMVGNRVLFRGVEDIIWRVEDNNYVTDNYGHGAYNQDLEPIPLTEEWLLKFGFTRLGQRKMWTKGKACVILMDYNDFERKTEGEVFYIGYKDMGNAIYHTQFELPYVHTLQNAYSLTGEELTINE